MSAKKSSIKEVKEPKDGHDPLFADFPGAGVPKSQDHSTKAEGSEPKVTASSVIKNVFAGVPKSSAVPEDPPKPKSDAEFKQPVSTPPPTVTQISTSPSDSPTKKLRATVQQLGTVDAKAGNFSMLLRHIESVRLAPGDRTSLATLYADHTGPFTMLHDSAFDLG